MEHLISIRRRNPLIGIQIHIIAKEDDVFLAKIFINCLPPKSASVNVGYNYHSNLVFIARIYICGRGWIRTNVIDICKCCPLTTKVRGLDRISYPSFPAPRLADRIRSISS